MKTVSTLLLGFGLIATIGCAKEKAESESSDGQTKAPVDGSKYVLTKEPDGVKDVIAARKDAQDEDEVVVVGRIGGSENPWVKGRAAFTIVDPSLKSCAEIGSDNCPKPWDFC